MQDNQNPDKTIHPSIMNMDIHEIIEKPNTKQATAKNKNESVSSILASLPEIGLNIFEPNLNENHFKQNQQHGEGDTSFEARDDGHHSNHLQEIVNSTDSSNMPRRLERQERPPHRQERSRFDKERTERSEKTERSERPETNEEGVEANSNRRGFQNQQNQRGENNNRRNQQQNQGQANQQNQRGENNNRRQNQQNQQNQPVSNLPPMYLTHLKSLHVAELVDLTVSLEIENAHRMRKQELMFAILKKQAKHGATIYGDGTLEVLSDGFGFLRSPETSYLASPDDIYVSPSQIRRFNLKTGDTIEGEVRVPKDGERYFALVKLDKVNKTHPEMMKNRIMFENLTPLHPNQQLILERDIKAEENITGRIIDIIAPVGKGQRALLVAPPKAGKTVMLQHIAHSITANHPDIELFVLLIDERPEEVTEMQRSVKGEVIASTFDEPASRHVQVAEMVIEKAKCLVEMKKDVVILLDSITRLARAYNTVAPASGKILTGGVDANALQRPKRFFGAARNIEEGGSLTIIATALVETGSKMDDVIYEEFKGTGNLEIILERRLAQRRIYPATNASKSGTRREELLLKPEIAQKVWLLRKLIGDMDDLDATEFLIDKLKQTKSNADFFDSMRRSS
jgi:transcription termination factor Rho